MIVDTGVVFGAMDASDSHHEAASRLLASADEILLPAPTLVELDWLSASRNVPATDAILRDIVAGAAHSIELTLEDYRRVRELCSTYADLPLGLVDASVVALAERYGETTVATFDRRHFSVVRPRHVEALTLVP